MIKRVILSALVLVLVIPLISGCGDSSSQPTPSDLIPSDPSVKSYNLKAESGDFAFSLFQQVASGDYEDNIVLSPLSAKLALAMAYNGAVDGTKEAMAKVLDLEGMSLEEANQQLGNLMTSLEQADEDLLLEIANSLWADDSDGYELRQDFVERCREWYDAEVANLNFFDPKAADTINAWVKEKTHDKIEKIVGGLSPEIALMLVNAVYFNGKWQMQFDASLTEDGDFHLLDGGTVTVPLMNQSGEYSYYEDEDLQAVSLPYGEGRMSMYVVLPREGRDYGEFLSTLSEANWEEWMGRFMDRKGELDLPRFKVEYEQSLNDALKAMGMTPAFSYGLEDMFTDLGGQKAYISEVLQKTYIDVNEEGTEAAAVTGVVVGITSYQPEPPPFIMTVDRPFFFAIRDNQTGTLLFMGSITNP
jgi:serpin B